MRPSARWKRGKGRQQPLPSTVLWISATFLFSVLVLSLALIDTQPAAADAPFAEIIRRTGRYGFVANGVGTRGDPVNNTWSGEGDVVITIPDTATVEMARLIWTGRSDAFDADGVQLTRGDTLLGTFTADIQHVQVPWCCSGSGQRHESADITNFVLPGTHTYTISDHEHGVSPTDDYLNYGVGIWVVYQDDSEPVSEVVIYEGQDSFFRQWPPPRGPHTEVRCADFAADTEDRVADVTHLVSGIDTYDSAANNTERLRSVAFWYLSGAGDANKPPQDEVIGDPVDKIPTLSVLGIGHDPGGQYPIQSYANLEWDNFHINGGIDVAAGEDWMCFQIESGDSQDLAGKASECIPPSLGGTCLEASGMWNLFALRLRPNDPGAVTLAAFTATADTDRNVTLRWDTAAEIDNFGFNLYRADNSAGTGVVKVNDTVIPAGNQLMNSYAYVDTVPTYGHYWYWLEDVEGDDANGRPTRHGPISVLVSQYESNFLPLITTQSHP